MPSGAFASARYGRRAYIRPSSPPPAFLLRGTFLAPRYGSGARTHPDGTCLHACRGATLQRMETVLSVLQVLIAVIVVFLVLMHSGKDSGLSGAFGVGSGTGPLGGGSMVERNLNRWTIFFAILFVVNTVVLIHVD